MITPKKEDLYVEYVGEQELCANLCAILSSYCSSFYPALMTSSGTFSGTMFGSFLSPKTSWKVPVEATFLATFRNLRYHLSSQSAGRLGPLQNVPIDPNFGPSPMPCGSHFQALLSGRICRRLRGLLPWCAHGIARASSADKMGPRPCHKCYSYIIPL